MSGQTFRRWWRGISEGLKDSIEIRRAYGISRNRVASTSLDPDSNRSGLDPDADAGEIRGTDMGWKNRFEDEDPPNPGRPPFGRRAHDMKSDHIITKKLVVVTVILVDALYLAGDALINGQVCP